jgi:hypothetical protein
MMITFDLLLMVIANSFLMNVAIAVIFAQNLALVHHRHD